MSDGELLTLTQAAALAGVDPASLRQAIREERLASIKPGRDHLVTRAEIGRYIRQRRTWRARTEATDMTSFNPMTVFTDPAPELDAGTLREREYAGSGVRVLVSYPEPDGVVFTAEGWLTAAHAASSYGIPVLVLAYSNSSSKPTWLGQPLGPAETPGVLLVVGDDPSGMIERAIAAGYRVRREEHLTID